MEYSKMPRRVRLNKDLTKYDPKCTEGIMGYTMPFVTLSEWGSWDHFVAVKFDNGVKLDVAINSLTFIEAWK